MDEELQEEQDELEMINEKIKSYEAQREALCANGIINEDEECYI